ncbi:CvpA family protein [Rubrivirga sp. S365]|uniref:CvpA family protein n=1 Tax=Rubrivirga litoralis TaxID=3075598 RepID=A0ABU3BTB6_9BACT|nr:MULTISPECIES: CvpA family protein [unclassified Rubrivirga]MDT0632538.1 CvpA family protein [Rubrivirga sp. F394]MDT7857003.1 CvpA family protein [Rubrivirga sp. S365]
MGRLDLILGLVLAVGVWRGLRTGALAQVVGTVGWVFAFIAATALMEPVGAGVAAGLGVSERLAPVLGFVAVVAAVVVALTVAAHVLRKAAEAVRLGGVDRLAGGAVGGLRAAFGLSVLLLATGYAPIPGGGPVIVSAETREASVLYGPVEALAPEVWGAVRAVTPGLQAALVDKFNTWHEGEPEAVTGEERLE